MDQQQQQLKENDQRIQQKQTLQTDSLLKMFSSEYFTDEMLIQYYFKYFGVAGTHDYLTNKLYEMKTDKVEVFIPYLCHMLIKNDSKQLEKFLIDMSGKSFSQFLLVFWCTHAFSAKDRLNKEKFTRIDKIERKMEMSMVNNIQIDTQKDKNQNNETEEHMLLQFQFKQHLSNYYSQVIRLISLMFKFSLTLKKFPKEDANYHLRMFIQKLNARIQNIRTQFPPFKQFQGIALPLSSWMDDKPNSRMVVNIIDSYYKCFHTKNRVPYMILLECIEQLDTIYQILISQEDLKDFKPQSQEDLSPIINEDLDHLTNDEKLEKLEIQMQEIVIDKQQSYHEALQKIVKYERKGKRQSYILQKLNKYQVVQEQSRSNHKLNDNSSVNNSNSHKRAQSDSKLDKIDQDNDIDLNNIKIQRSKSLVDDQFEYNKTQDFYEKLILEFPQKEYFLRNKLVAQYKAYCRINDVPKSPTHSIWNNQWDEQQEEIRLQSPYGQFPSYKLRPVIFKGGDDLRQELLVLHMMTEFQRIFQRAELNLPLRPYSITVTSANSGIVEYIPNTISIDGLKKHVGAGTKTLYQIYKEIFDDSFEEAQKNFIESLAAYSLFTYLMSVKDRHNGNMLIDSTGHIIHIDFGFVLGSSPGNMNFETAPFKLTQEYVELMKGRDSDFFGYFRTLLIRGVFELKKYVNDLQYLLLIMKESSDLTCFRDFDMKSWRTRFMEGGTDKEVKLQFNINFFFYKIFLNQIKCIDAVDGMIYSSLYSWRTAQYDNFQKITNSILP